MADQNKENIVENVKLDDSKDILDIKKIIPKKKNYKVLLLSSFIKELKENKLFLLCFIITIISIFIFSGNKVKEADGAFPKNDKIVTEENKTTNEQKTEKLDITKYIGHYIKNFKLEKEVKYGECSIIEYDYVYEIKKDNTISKYFNSKCTGMVLINKDTLGYIKSENTRNIGSKHHIYIFKDNKMNELDGLTYQKDKNYKPNKNLSQNKDIKLKFYNDKFILEGIKELYLINGNHIETNIEVNSLLTKSIFSNDNTYRYIMYNDTETQNCYVPELIAEVGFEDKESYSIYSLLFNEQTLEFEEPKLVVTRKRSDNCDTLNNDLASMVS